jgi:hypothetical protein
MASIALETFWTKMRDVDKTAYKRIIQTLMMEYGTALPCNRFGIGNCNEYAIADVIRSTGLIVEELQNAKRVDIRVRDFGDFSLKFTTVASVKLHNSLGANTDMTLTDTLLVTPTEWWYLTQTEIAKHGLTISDYLKNNGDGLTLNLKLLKELKKRSYPWVFACDLELDKSKCKNQEIARLIYDAIKARVA